MELILGLLVIIGALGVVAIPSLLWVAIGQGRRIEKLMDRNAVQAQALALQRPDASGYPILSTHGFERASHGHDCAYCGGSGKEADMRSFYGEGEREPAEPPASRHGSM